VAAGGHAAAGLAGGVALGVEEEVAVGGGGGVEVLADEDLEVLEAPGLPAFKAEAEVSLAAGDGDGVDAEGGGEVVVEPAEHLHGFVDLHRAAFETVVVAEGGDDGDMDAGDGGGAEVDGDGAFAMREGIEYALASGEGSGHGGTRLSDVGIVYQPAGINRRGATRSPGRCHCRW